MFLSVMALVKHLGVGQLGQECNHNFFEGGCKPTYRIKYRILNFEVGVQLIFLPLPGYIPLWGFKSFFTLLELKWSNIAPQSIQILLCDIIPLIIQISHSNIHQMAIKICLILINPVWSLSPFKFVKNLIHIQIRNGKDSHFLSPIEPSIFISPLLSHFSLKANIIIYLLNISLLTYMIAYIWNACGNLFFYLHSSWRAETNQRKKTMWKKINNLPHSAFNFSDTF